MVLDITLRLIVALILGGCIGIERDYRSKDAGFRTHFLVALGSALFCIVSQYGFGFDLKDSSRVAAQVVSGIGFLGAGTIIFQKNVVRGLTTAAGLWVTAAIGLACGTGMYMAAVITTFLVILGLEVLVYFVPRIGTTTVEISFTTPSKDKVKDFMIQLRHEKMDIYSYKLKETHNAAQTIYAVSLELKMKRRHSHSNLIGLLNEFQDVSISAME